MTPIGVGVDPAATPVAPGSLGVALDPTAALSYLDALGRWRDDRRRELDQLDTAALASPKADALTHDIILSMALWKAVADRYDLLLASWDSGRAGEAERMRMSALIWGRLDATLDRSPLKKSGALATSGSTSRSSALAVSLPEACRLSDALAGQLRVQLALDPTGLQIAEHLRQLRAQLERIRDQAMLEPGGQMRDSALQQLHALNRRLSEISEKATRGGDVGGLLAPLEIDAARFERDLIVGAAHRRDAHAKVDRARKAHDDLEIREAALNALVTQCLAAVEPAPRYAVPDVDALGEIPNTEAELDLYLHRLDQVSRAMTMAQTAYASALHERDELLSRLDAYKAKASSHGVADDEDVAQAYAMAQQALLRQPTRMVIANQLVTLYQSYLTLLNPSGGAT